MNNCIISNANLDYCKFTKCNFKNLNYKNYHELIGHKSKILCVAFTLDGNYLASGCKDGTLKLWTVELKKELATLRGHT